MRLTDADAIASVAGVAAADPRVEVFWESDPAVGFSVPDTINGLIPGADAGYESFELELATGRMLTVDDAGDVVVLGSDLAREHNVVAGDSIDIRDRAFEVIGTLQQTLTAPDNDRLCPTGDGTGAVSH